MTAFHADPDSPSGSETTSAPRPGAPQGRSLPENPRPESSREGIAERLAHALNNPLGYALANLTYAIERLRAGTEGSQAPPEELLAALSEALDGTERVRGTVNELLASARTSASTTAPRPVDLRTMVDAAVTVVASDVGSVILRRDYAPVPRVIASSEGLVQVFSRILADLVHARAATAAAPARIDIQIAGAGDRVGVQITSARGGLDGSQRGPRGRADLEPSSCGALIEELGGAFEVTTGPEGGTAFRMSWPSAPAPSEATARVEQEAPASRRMRIVVIDDEELITRVVERILRTEHDVVCFVHSAEGLEHLRAGPEPDLVLCDLMMPEMTGMDLFERVQATLPHLADRIVFLSGGASSSRAREFLEKVANTRLAKPFTAAALRALVRERGPAAPSTP